MSTTQIAFCQSGKTIVVAADASAPLGVQAPSTSSGTSILSGQYRIVNAGSNTVFLGVGSTATIAQSNTVAPIAGTSAIAIPLVPGAVEIFSFGESSFFSGLASAATTLYITPGTGI